MADSLDILRKDVFEKRVSSFSGKHWQPHDRALWREYIYDMPTEALRRAARTPARKVVAPDLAAIRKELANSGAAIATDAPRNRLWIINTSAVDLEKDIIYPKGVSLAVFGRNGIVPFGHDTSKIPVAKSDMPFVSGDRLMAVARFPEPGVSADSDQVLAAINAGLVRGASVGLIPTRWGFSKDPGRPLGVDIYESTLLEWSIVSLPCNSECLQVGPVSEKSIDQYMTAARQSEARALVSQARASEKVSSAAPMTREQRLAEARALRRLIS